MAFRFWEKTPPNERKRWFYGGGILVLALVALVAYYAAPLRSPTPNIRVVHDAKDVAHCQRRGQVFAPPLGKGPGQVRVRHGPRALRAMDEALRRLKRAAAARDANVIHLTVDPVQPHGIAYKCP